MNRTLAKKEVVDVVAMVLHISEEDVLEDATLKSLGADSLDHVEIAMYLEDNLGIKITDDEIMAFKDVKSLVDTITTKNPK